MTDILLTELAGCVLGALMWISSLLLLITFVLEWRHAETIAEREVARRIMASAVYRSLAKSLIWLDMMLIFLARFRQIGWVRTWFTHYPLILFFILLVAMGLLTINNIIEWYWRKNFAGTIRTLIENHNKKTEEEA